MDVKNFFALAFVVAGIFISLSGSVNAYNVEGGGVCNCSSCSDCTNALQDNANCSSLYHLPSKCLSGQIPITNCMRITQPGTYYLANDIINSATTKCIDIQANNVVLDCQGHMIDGIDSSDSYGIYVSKLNSNNIIIKNCIVSDWDVGIYLASDVRYGDPSSTVSGYTLSNNTANSNNKGIYVYVRGDVASSTFKDSNFNNNTVSNNNYGFHLHTHYKSTLSNNNFTGNIINNNNFGLYLSSDSSSNSYQSYTSNNIFTNNNLTNNNYGIYLYRYATGGGNPNYAHVSNNKFYNNFLNNTANVYFNTAYAGAETNYWSTTLQSGKNIIGGNLIGGNYWANPSGTGFSQTCSDADKNGICDSAYTLATNNIDHLPLTLLTCSDGTLWGNDTERMLYVMRLLVENYNYSVNGAAGIVGNLYAESYILPNRIEGSNKSTPMYAPDCEGSDKKFTLKNFTPKEVMNRNCVCKTRENEGGKKVCKEWVGKGPRFAGVGIAQWTYPPERRKGLFNHSYNGKVLGEYILCNMDAQVDYLVWELNHNYTELNKILKNRKVTVRKASDEFLLKFEIPLDTGEDVQARRGNLSKKALCIYNNWKKNNNGTTGCTYSCCVPYDLDGNGNVDIFDVVTGLEYLSGERNEIFNEEFSRGIDEKFDFIDLLTLISKIGTNEI